MMHIKWCILIITMTLLTGLFIGCERRPLEDEYYENALIPVRIDWTTLANLDPDNDPNNTVKSASIWFFPKNGDKALEFRFNNPKGEDIQVPLGEYSVIVPQRKLRMSAVSMYTSLFYSNIIQCSTLQIGRAHV